MTAVKNVHEAWTAVMDDVKAIEKTDRNTQQGFAFRGIDAVMQAVGPALRKHGVYIIPSGMDLKSETYQTKSNTTMRNVTVTMKYTVTGPAGDRFEGVSFGEAADVGDKAVTKAQSVAYRTFLLQSLTVPTGDPDPDSFAHERAPERSPADEARDELLAVADELGWKPEKLNQRFYQDYGTDIRAADAGVIRGFTVAIKSEAKAQDAEKNGATA
jgi:hypothetical protein